MKKEIEQTIKDFIAEQKSIPSDEITLTSSLDELGIDSLDAVSLIFEIEDAYGVEVSNEALMTLKTIQDIVDNVDILIQEK